MHPFGHDITLRPGRLGDVLSRGKSLWKGRSMVDSRRIRGVERARCGGGLFTLFPSPTLRSRSTTAHTAPKVGTAGLRVRQRDRGHPIHAREGHGAYPHTTIDPIVIAARTVLALQTIVGRENNPLDPAVVTVGSIHGGTKHNIIPDEVKLQLTVRSYKDDVRKRLLDAIARIAKAEAAAAGATRPPDVKVTDDGTPAVFNDPVVTKRIADALSRELGAANVSEGQPVMAGEDFSEYGRAAATVCLGRHGGPKKFEARKPRSPLPSLHYSEFARTRAVIRNGVKRDGAALELWQPMVDLNVNGVRLIADSAIKVRPGPCTIRHDGSPKRSADTTVPASPPATLRALRTRRLYSIRTGESVFTLGGRTSCRPTRDPERASYEEITTEVGLANHDAIIIRFRRSWPRGGGPQQGVASAIEECVRQQLPRRLPIKVTEARSRRTDHRGGSPLRLRPGGWIKTGAPRGDRREPLRRLAHRLQRLQGRRSHRHGPERNPDEQEGRAGAGEGLGARPDPDRRASAPRAAARRHAREAVCAGSGKWRSRGEARSRLRPRDVETVKI